MIRPSPTPTTYRITFGQSIITHHHYTFDNRGSSPAEPGQAQPLGQARRAGHQVVQLKDAKTNKFVAVAVDGDVKVYGGSDAQSG